MIGGSLEREGSIRGVNRRNPIRKLHLRGSTHGAPLAGVLNSSPNFGPNVKVLIDK